MVSKRWGRAVAIAMISCLALVGLDSVSYAATGKSLILGKVNQANKVTVVKRPNAGPAMKFVTKPKSAPFLVTSGQKVGKLNADKVDGFNGGDLATNVVNYVDNAGGSFGTQATWVVDIAPGIYHMDVNAAVILNDGATSAACFLIYNPTGNPVSSETSLFAGAPEVGSVGGGGVAGISGSGVVQIKPGFDYRLVCGVDTGTFQFSTGITLSVSKVNSLKTATLEREDD